MAGEKDYYKTYDFSKQELCEQKIDADINCTYSEPPSNFDSEIKNEIKNYLENIQIPSISKENNQYEYCYNFSYHKLEHTFCFNKQDMITLAQWGSNITESRSTSIDINKVELI